MKRAKGLILIIIIVLFFVTPSCKKGNTNIEEQTGNLVLTLDQKISGNAINYDTMIYVNEAGNKYTVNLIQYFISDVTLHRSDGTSLLLDGYEDIHYVDTDIDSTKTYTFKDNIPVGTYNTISFTFGINEKKNKSLMFVNPPESFMFWPEKLGGGYHYMKLNGSWVNTSGQVSPFNFHLGIGQIYESFPDSITRFVQNYFNVKMAEIPIEINAKDTCRVEVTMNVENWFQSPNTYDHNYWGGEIMQNQEAMQQVVENGFDVFSYNIK